MKDLLLKPQAPYFNHLEIDVFDFPKGLDHDPSWRMTLTVDYGKFDVDQLKREGMDMEASMKYYRDWIYSQIRVRLLDDWNAVSGLDESLDIVRDHIKDMFEEQY